jgi:serine/threonine protein kinase
MASLRDPHTGVKATNQVAPEVIELRESSAASDIWSCGCTAIELFTGYPPYYDLEQISALFRIVTDDMPPLPLHSSPLFHEFLKNCFRRDYTIRSSASSLAKHAWIKKFMPTAINTVADADLNVESSVKKGSNPRNLLHQYVEESHGADYTSDFIDAHGS